MLAVCVLASWALAGCRASEGREPSAGAYAAADAVMRRAMADSTEWPSYGRDYTNQRWSPLAQIHTGNVDSLQLAWRYRTGLPHAFEASPVVVNGTMYVSTPLNHVLAFDAATGRKKWEYTHPLGTTIHCCGPVNRGVAVYDGRVYMGTLDAKLVALDTADGHVVWTAVVGEPKQGYSITPAPLAVRGKIITGISGGEYGARGYMSAYDAATGTLVWRFYTVPSPEEGGWWGQWKTTDPFGTSLNRDIAQERRDSATYADAWQRGGAPVWQTPAVDLARNLLIFGTGNVSPDVDGSVRPGDNLYGNSVVALDLETGKLKWYMQEVPHDRWDYDAVSPVVLVDVRDATGKVVPAVTQAGKTGWLYVVDRQTGRPIRRSEPFVFQQHMFTPPTTFGSRVQAGAFGGSEWSPTAYSPQTGYVYVLGLQEPIIYKVRHEERVPGAWWVGGAYYAGRTQNQGTITAVDPSTGRIAWQVPTPRQMVGGALATAGGLVFTGTADQEVLALDARTGQTRWRFLANAGVNAPPVTFMLGGTQYLAVVAGGNWLIDTPRGDEVLVFRLGTPQQREPGATPKAQHPSGRH